MENTITNRQMALILILTITSFSVVDIPKLLAQSAGTGSWLTLAVATALFAMAAWMWAKLNAMNAGKMVADYSREIAGSVVSWLIVTFLLLYFFTILVDLYELMSAMLQANFLPETPRWITTMAALAVIGFVANKGVTVTARLVEIFGVIFLFIAAIFHTIMVLQGDINHILPLYTPAETGKYLLSVRNIIYPFLGAEVLAVLPFNRKESRKAGRTAIFTLAALGIFYTLVVESSFMMVSTDEIIHYNYPLIVAIRQVELPVFKVFQRVDVLYLTVGFIGLFAGMSVLYLSVLELICRILPKLRRSMATLCIGIAAFIANMSLQNIRDIEKILMGIITWLGVFAAFVIPAALLLIATVKKHANRKNT